MALTLSAAGTTALQAQGFVRTYPFFTWADGGSQSVFPRADGTFQFTALAYPDFGVEINLLWQNTDEQGVATDFVSTLVPMDATHQLFLLENGGYLNAFATGGVLEVECVDPANNLFWTTELDFGGVQYVTPMALTTNEAGEIFGRGLTSMGAGVDSGFVFKLSPAGDVLWLTGHPIVTTFVLPESLEPTPDGGCVFANYYWDGVSDESILRFGPDGSLLWSYVPENAALFSYVLNSSIAVQPNGEILVPVQVFNTAGSADSLMYDRLSANGTRIQRINLVEAIGVQTLNPLLAIPAPNNEWLVVVQHYQLNAWYRYAARIDAAGTVLWHKPLNFFPDAFPLICTDGAALPDGSFVIFGSQNDLFLIKMGPDGAIYPHSLTGQVVRDSTFDCLVSPGDPALDGWVARASGNGPTRYATTGADGRYTITDLENGNYIVDLAPPNYLWEPCADSVAVSFTGTTPQTDTVDFALQPLYDCPVMQVDLGAVALVRCFSNKIHAQYCNTGNQTATSAGLAVVLDPLLLVDSASADYSLSGDTLLFELGEVAPGACGFVDLYVTVDCDAALGQTLCAAAHVTPDTICALNLPGWSGAQIEVSAVCQGDSVQFEIRNTGLAPTSQALDFIVVDDHVITRQGNFHLDAGETHPEWVPADGSTWRLTAQQEPGFPFGMQMPSVAVEGCTPLGEPFSTGMFNLFPNYSGDPFDDIFCQTVVGSYDPNDKQAFPIGVDAEHYIERNQPIDYLIRFQNTGTAPAFTVVVRDTLSPWLDPATVRPGAGSHPYSWSLSGPGVLTFTFNDINLPDSNANEAASHGFVQFWVQQKNDVPLGALVENRAGIYFDFNDPILTNTVFHTIGEDFLPLSAPETPAMPALRIWPNPARQQATVWAGQPFSNGQRLTLRDAAGRLIGDLPVAGTSAEIRRGNLPAGLYFLELRDARRVLAVGKMVWSD